MLTCASEGGVNLDPLTGVHLRTIRECHSGLRICFGGSTCSHCWFWLICYGPWCGCTGNGSVVGARTAWRSDRARKSMLSRLRMASKHTPNEGHWSVPDADLNRFGLSAKSGGSLPLAFFTDTDCPSPDDLLRILRFAARRSITLLASSNSKRGGTWPILKNCDLSTATRQTQDRTQQQNRAPSTGQILSCRRRCYARQHGFSFCSGWPYVWSRRLLPERQ